MQKLKSYFTLQKNYEVKPLGFGFRSNTLFIVSTVGIGLFTGMFLVLLFFGGEGFDALLLCCWKKGYAREW